MEDLNASTPERTDNRTDNPRNETKDNRRGANLVPPGYGAEEGGGVTPHIMRGTKTGNKVLSLWKGGK